jgi:hypothetical protein
MLHLHRGVPGGNANIRGGHSSGHSKHKSVYCDTGPESRNNPLPDNGSLIHVSVTSRKSFARQRLGKHRLKAGRVEQDTELSIC